MSTYLIKRAFKEEHIEDSNISSDTLRCNIMPSAGGHTVGPPSLGDDHHRAPRRPAGRSPPQQEHPVNHHRQENHELWR